MFDAAFNAVTAWNQAGLMIAGLAFLLIGGALFTWFFYVRMECRRVLARIVAVRATGIGESDTPAPAEPPSVEEKPSWESFGREFRKTPGTGIAALFFALLIVGIPLLFVGIGAWFGYDYLSLVNGGVQVEATVVDNVYRRGSEGESSYHAVVRFKDMSGAEVRYEDKISIGSSPSYKTGETVIVHYEAGNPKHAVVGGLWHNMVLPFAFMLMGGLFLFFVFGGGKWLAGAWRGRRGERKPRVSYAKEMYHAVYEYKARNGETIRAESDCSSNLIGDKIPGTQHYVYVRDDRPDQVSRPGFLVLFFGLVFGAPGVAMLWIAFTQFKLSLFTPAFVIAFLVYCGFKLKKIIKPRDQWETKDSFRQRMKEKRDAERGQGRLLTAQEVRDRVRIYNRNARISAPFLILIGAALLAGGAHFGQGMKTFLTDAQGAAGKVVRLESSRDSEGHYTYYPVVAFDGAHGNRTEFRDRVGSNPSPYQQGDSVRILYDPADPHHAIIDRGIWNWAASAGLLLAGVFMLWGAMRSFAGIRRRERL